MAKGQHFFNLLIGALVGAPLLALLAAGSQATGLTYAPFALFNGITRALPGPLVTFGIDAMIDAPRALGINVADTAKVAEQAMAVLLALAFGALAGPLMAQILRGRPRIGGLWLGATAGLLMIPLIAAFGRAQRPMWAEALWTMLYASGWGASLGAALRRGAPALSEPEAAHPSAAQARILSRRQFLLTLGTASAAMTVVGTGLAAVLGEDATSLGGSATLPVGSPLPNPKDALQPAPGTRPEYTPLEDHYKVFIGLEPSRVEVASLTLAVMGLVQRPLRLSLQDLREGYTQVERYVTLSCISGRIPTTLIGTTLWSGVALAEVLAKAGLKPQARYLHIRSADGFYETLDLALLEEEPRVMLCHSWDGRPLPEEHGAPLRIWIPDRFGMKQPKWIAELEVSDRYEPGYWVKRGWDEEARIRTRSVIDTVAVNAVFERDGQRLVPIGGIAFAGVRGISRVQLRVDGGPWQEALLRAPLSEATWVIWRFDWPFRAGEHTFEVRCFEADGTPQITQANPPRPSGATGIHRVNKQLG